MKDRDRVEFDTRVEFWKHGLVPWVSLRKAPGSQDEQPMLTGTGSKGGGDLSAGRSPVMGTRAEKLEFHVSGSTENQDMLLRTW